MGRRGGGWGVGKKCLAQAQAHAIEASQGDKHCFEDGKKLGAWPDVEGGGAGVVVVSLRCCEAMDPIEAE